MKTAGCLNGDNLALFSLGRMPHPEKTTVILGLDLFTISKLNPSLHGSLLWLGQHQRDAKKIACTIWTKWMLRRLCFGRT